LQRKQKEEKEEKERKIEHGALPLYNSKKKKVNKSERRRMGKEKKKHKNQKMHVIACQILHFTNSNLKTCGIFTKFKFQLNPSYVSSFF
jgi:hypothetical protein